MLVNLTRHEIVILDAGDAVVARVPPSGSVARIAVVETAALALGGIVYYDTRYGALEGLPDRSWDPNRPAETYIVSLVVAQAARAVGRDDVVCPGELVRSREGQPIGCRGLRRPSGSVVPGPPVSHDPRGMIRGLAERQAAVEQAERPVSSAGGHSE